MSTHLGRPRSHGSGDCYDEGLIAGLPAGNCGENVGSALDAGRAAPIPDEGTLVIPAAPLPQLRRGNQRDVETRDRVDRA